MRLSLKALLVLTALALVAQATPQQVAPNNSGVIRGTVKVAATGAPLDDVQLTLSVYETASQRIQRTAITDSSGRFEFRNLPVGAYSLNGDREGHWGSSSSRSVSASGNLTRDLPVQDVHLTMVQGAVISGRVLAPDGKPTAGVYVVPLRLGYSDGQPVLNRQGSAPITDDRGDYRVFWPYPGEYYLRTEMLSSLASRGLQGFYYPGVMNADAAVPVVAREGKETSGVDIQIASIKRFSVSGQVNILLGDPEAQLMSLNLVPRGSKLWDSSIFATPQTFLESLITSNSFTLTGVPSGSYDLYPIVRDPVLGIHTVRTPIDIYSDRSGITATVVPRTTVKGRLILNGASRSGGLGELSVTLQRGIRESQGQRSPSANPKEAGEFQLPGASVGFYRVGLSLISPGLYLADIRYGAQSIYDTTAFDYDGRSASVLEITLSSGGGTIRGSAPAGARIFLIPERTRRANRSLYKRGNLNAAGQFTIADIAPGDYKLFAWEFLISGAEENAEFLSRYETRGIPVTIRPGTTITDIKLDVLR